MRIKRPVTFCVGFTLVAIAGTAAVSYLYNDEPRPLLATVKCGSDSPLWTIELRDPETGKVTQTRYFRLPSADGANCNEAAPVVRSLFNGSYDKLAYRKEVGEGILAGYLKPTDDPKKVSEFVDRSGDDEAGTRPRQLKATFGPGDNLYIVQDADPRSKIAKEQRHRLLKVSTDGQKALPKEVFAKDQRIQAYLDGSASISDDAPEGHNTTDDQGNLVVSRGAMYFLAGGKKPELESHPNTVYNNDGSWGFTREVPGDESGTTMRFGDLQGDGSDINTVKMDERKDGSWIDIGPVVFVNKGAFISRTYSGIDFVKVDRDKGAKVAGSLSFKENQDVTSVTELDNKRFAYVVITTDANNKKRSCQLFVADKTPEMKRKQLTTLDCSDPKMGAGVLGMTG